MIRNRGNLVKKKKEGHEAEWLFLLHFLNDNHYGYRLKNEPKITIQLPEFEKHATVLVT